MTDSVYEFPLNEKIRTYLRIENLFKQLMVYKTVQENWQHMSFFETLFTILDMLERLDIRTDGLKDIEVHERNLLHWSEHPKIDKTALNSTLQQIVKVKTSLKQARKIGAGLKDNRFLTGIRQRFNVPGGTCSFDLPALHYLLKKPIPEIQEKVDSWISEFDLIQETLQITLTFLRERGKFEDTVAERGFYQGNTDEKIDLIRVHCTIDENFYPILSGNKYRYVIRFVQFAPDQEEQVPVESDVQCKIAFC
jgi:cell division protein ZapD